MSTEPVAFLFPDVTFRLRYLELRERAIRPSNQQKGAVAVAPLAKFSLYPVEYSRNGRRLNQLALDLYARLFGDDIGHPFLVTSPTR